MSHHASGFPYFNLAVLFLLALAVLYMLPGLLSALTSERRANLEIDTDFNPDAAFDAVLAAAVKRVGGVQ